MNDNQMNNGGEYPEDNVLDFAKEKVNRLRF
jgi:hypothetical protein